MKKPSKKLEKAILKKMRTMKAETDRAWREVCKAWQ
jgi:hypothetical protein